jgi:arylsulfatase A-like enzyme
MESVAVCRREGTEMKKYLITALIVAVSLPAFAVKKPNILFILADDQTWEGIGAMNPEVKTPNLDKLVENGVSFQRAYNMGAWNGAVCVASRSMFNTGRYVWRCDSLANRQKAWAQSHPDQPLPDLGKSWSQLLSDVGYRTYFAGKWHIQLFDPENIFDAGRIQPAAQ